MRSTAVLWLAVWASCAQNLQGRTRIKLVPRLLEQMQGCANTLDTYNHTVHTDKHLLYMADMDVIFHASAEYWTQLSVKLDKCRGGISSNTCEYFGNWKWNAAVCTVAVTRGMPWTPITDSFHPKFRCPFQAGRYQLRNLTIDTEKTALFLGRDMMVGNTWLGEVHLLDERGRIHICFKFKGEVLRTRVPVD